MARNTKIILKLDSKCANNQYVLILILTNDSLMDAVFRVIQELKKIEKRTHLDSERFYEFCRYHQAMLFPAFQLQLKLQERIMGTSFWRKCTNRRVELSKGTYVTMGDLMEMVRKYNLKYWDQSPLIISLIHTALAQRIVSKISNCRIL